MRGANRLRSILRCFVAVIGLTLFLKICLSLLPLQATGLPNAPSSRTLALIEGGSMEPAVLGLRGKYMPQSERASLSVDEYISFRLPAAAWAVVDLLGPGPHRIGVRVWSHKLDPVRLDVDADRDDCAPDIERCRRDGSLNKRVRARYAAGEYVLRAEVTSVLWSTDERNRIMLRRVGMDPRHANVSGDRCSFRYDEELDMLATDRMSSLQAAAACHLVNHLGTDLTGRYSARNFMKLAPDGTPRFVVRCNSWPWEQAPERPWFCELQGYIGIWPLFIWVPTDRPSEWDEIFLRVKDYLTSFITERSN